MTFTQKVFLAALVCCLMGATSMYADVIEPCFMTPTTIISNGASGSTSFACPGAGLTLGSLPGQDSIAGTLVTIYETADFAYGANPTTVQTAFSGAGFTAYTCTETGASVSAPSVCTSGGPTAGNAESQASVAAWASDSTGTTAFTISASATVTGGSLGSADAGVYVDYAYTVNPSGVPEPATLTLFGSGLLALGFAARKRSKKVSQGGRGGACAVEESPGSLGRVLANGQSRGLEGKCNRK